MIDLDKLAETRARQLQQDEAAWCKAVWSQDFQKLSQALSDGEVEMFFESCRTVSHFESMTKYLMETVQFSGITFGEVLDKVARSGYQLIDWFDAIIEIKRWAETHKKSVSFFEILMFVNSCALKSGENADPLLDGVRTALSENKLGS